MNKRYFITDSEGRSCECHLWTDEFGQEWYCPVRPTDDWWIRAPKNVIDTDPKFTVDIYTDEIHICPKDLDQHVKPETSTEKPMSIFGAISVGFLAIVWLNIVVKNWKTMDATDHVLLAFVFCIGMAIFK